MTHAQDTFIITMPPRQLSAMQGWQAVPAYLAYRLGPGPHLYRAEGAALPRGGLMAIGDRDFDALGQTAPLCQEIVRECQARGAAGAVLDFERRLPPLEQVVLALDGAFARRGWLLVVPEHYGRCAAHARVAISSALSGGSLEQRLAEGREQFGQDRVALALEQVAEDLVLPAPSGSGRPLSQEQLRALLERLRPAVFFSGELCARYFTYMEPGGTAHFVLFDDGDTLVRKVEVARRANIHTFLIAWDQAAPHMEALGVRPAGGGVSGRR